MDEATLSLLTGPTSSLLLLLGMGLGLWRFTTQTVLPAAKIWVDRHLDQVDELLKQHEADRTSHLLHHHHPGGRLLHRGGGQLQPHHLLRPGQLPGGGDGPGGGSHPAAGRAADHLAPDALETRRGIRSRKGASLVPIGGFFRQERSAVSGAFQRVGRLDLGQPLQVFKCQG